MRRTWLITGCSTGIGRLLTERALSQGDQVVATARRPETLADLGADSEAQILRLPLDVTLPEQITAAVKHATELFGGIDVLVNNAGYGYFSTQEEASLEGVRQLFETNVLGLIAMTQEVLPQMREAGTGVVVNLSSMAGKIATPRAGYYQASKWAVEALSEALFLENHSFGLRVIVIEPGRFETQFTSSAQLGPAENDPQSPYAHLRKTWQDAGLKLFPDFQNAEVIIDAIWNSLQSEQKFCRVPVGVDAEFIIRKREELGDAAYVEWIRQQFDTPRD